MPLQVNVESTPDPLAYIVTIPLTRPLQKTSRDPVREYFRIWASWGDCDVPRMPILNHQIRAEVLTKTRRRKITDERWTSTPSGDG